MSRKPSAGRISLAKITMLSLITGCSSGDQPANHSVTNAETKPAVLVETYQNAERFLPQAKAQYILNDSLIPNWIGDEDRFWYIRQLPGGGKQFVAVDATTGQKQPAFDHGAVAKALGTLLERDVSATSLPFDTFTFTAASKPSKPGKAQSESANPDGIDFRFKDNQYHCADSSCTVVDAPKPVFGPLETPSPDGKWAVYFKDHNLWLKSADGSTNLALTTDGEEAFGYGTQIGSSTSYITLLRQQGGYPPQVLWAPDSTKILTQRIDEREVLPLSLIEYAPMDGSLRPRTYTMRYAFAGDAAKPMASFVVFEIPQGKRQDIDYPPIELSFISLTAPNSQEVWWSKGSAAFGFAHRKPFARGYSINRVDLASGRVSTEFDRTTDLPSFPGFLNPFPPLIAELKDGGLIWLSDESGYSHLYRKDPRGEVTQLTSGEWNVSMINRIDEESGRVFFVGTQSESVGNPYYFFYYSVGLDGMGLQQLTPEQANHGAAYGWMGAGNSPYSPSGKYLVDTWSSSTQPGQSELRDNEGKLIAVLETTDISALQASGFVPPRPFEVKAEDNKTTLYGTLFYPSNFDPQKSYPLINSIYPGPQVWRDSHAFSRSIYTRGYAPQALAELGFIVMAFDGRGTPGRSRDFQYQDGINILEKAGYLEDHVAAIRQLAQRETYIDINRVGIYGWSGGGYASVHAMLTYPDFFKVAVSGAGNHDPRTYIPVWGESYLGPNDGENYQAGSNAHLAGQLKGKLLLAYGALDDNVHPGNSMALIEALIRANKDFDLVVLPNANHLPGDYEAYYTRRMWDFFVLHLLGATPPKDFAIGSTQESSGGKED